MLYLNNFIPIRVYYSETLDAYRLETCMADKDTIVFNEDFIANKLPPSFRLLETIYGVNPRVFPPVPVGTSLFSVTQNDNPPYETVSIDWIAFPIMSNVSTSQGGFSFFAFTTPPSQDAKPWYIRNEETRVKLTFDMGVIGSYFGKTPFYARSLDRDNFVLFVYDSPRLYWRGTSEAMCVPSTNPSDFKTLVACQKAIYRLNRNHRSFTGNSAIPLSEMRSKIYPSPATVPWLEMGVFSVAVLVACVFAYRQYVIWKRSKTPESP